jgi:transcriptional regulator with XRE-family HTH domain
MLMPEVNSKFAQKLKECRGKHSLYEIEKQSGISRSLLRRYESGVHVPEMPMMQRLSDFYKMPLAELQFAAFEDLYPEGIQRNLLFQWVDTCRPSS